MSLAMMKALVLFMFMTLAETTPDVDVSGIDTDDATVGAGGIVHDPDDDIDAADVIDNYHVGGLVPGFDRGIDADLVSF